MSIGKEFRILRIFSEIIFQSDEKQAEREKRAWSKWQMRWKQLYEYEHSRIEPEPSFYNSTEQKGVRREEQ